MKYTPVLAVVLWTASGVGCTATDNVIGMLSGEGGPRASGGNDGGFTTTSAGAAEGGVTNTGIGRGGSTNRGGVPPVEMVSAGTANAMMAGAGGTGVVVNGTGGGSRGTAGTPGATGFSCAISPATCGLIHDWTFSMSSQWQGTYTYQEASMTADKTTDPTVFRVTGMVSNYDGFGVYSGKCTSLAGFSGVTFTLKGKTASVDTPSNVTFFILTNSDEPIDTISKTGACVGQAGIDCISPHKVIKTSDMPQTILFSDLAGGRPAAALDVTHVVGLRWEIEPDVSRTPFAIDLSLSDVSLVGGRPMGDCSMGSGG